MKRETKARFRSLLPMTGPSKSMKRSTAKIQALVSRETALVSRRFMFRFTPYPAGGGYVLGFRMFKENPFPFRKIPQQKKEFHSRY